MPNSKQNHAHLSESGLTRHFILDRRHLPRCPDLSNVWHFRRNFSMKMLKPREVSISDSPRWQVAAGKQIQEMSFWRSGDKVAIKHHQTPSNTIKHHQTPTLFLAYWTKASNFAKTCLSGSCHALQNPCRWHTCIRRVVSDFQVTQLDAKTLSETQWKETNKKFR